MTEIRPIKESEGQAFLKLLCDVFELDLERASGIFFSDPMFELNRKWALFEGREMISILTTVPLQFGWGRAIGIAGVATDAKRQSEGHAAKLLRKVLDESKKANEGQALLFAKDDRVYSKVGFEPIDSVVRGVFAPPPDFSLHGLLNFSEIRAIYDRWSEADPNRLRRDEKRWSYWKWNLRVCTPFGDGYVCHEGANVREIVSIDEKGPWKFAEGDDFVGLQSMVQRLELPLTLPVHELHLMGYGFSNPPEMFMTDQF